MLPGYFPLEKFVWQLITHFYFPIPWHTDPFANILFPYFSLSYLLHRTYISPILHSLYFHTEFYYAQHSFTFIPLKNYYPNRKNHGVTQIPFSNPTNILLQQILYSPKAVLFILLYQPYSFLKHTTLL